MKKLTLVLGIIGTLSIATAAHALSLGKINVQSSFSEPLVAQIELPAATQQELDDINLGLASEVDFLRAGLEKSSDLYQLRFALRQRNDGSAYIAVYTQRAVNNLMLSFLLEANTKSGRVLRNYDIILNLPQTSPKHSDSNSQFARTPTQQVTKQARVSAPAPKPVKTALPRTNSTLPKPVVTPEFMDDFSRVPLVLGNFGFNTVVATPSYDKSKPYRQNRLAKNDTKSSTTGVIQRQASTQAVASAPVEKPTEVKTATVVAKKPEQVDPVPPVQAEQQVVSTTTDEIAKPAAKQTEQVAQSKPVMPEKQKPAPVQQVAKAEPTFASTANAVKRDATSDLMRIESLRRQIANEQDIAANLQSEQNELFNRLKQIELQVAMAKDALHQMLIRK